MIDNGGAERTGHAEGGKDTPSAGQILRAKLREAFTTLQKRYRGNPRATLRRIQPAQYLDAGATEREMGYRITGPFDPENVFLIEPITGLPCEGTALPNNPTEKWKTDLRLEANQAIRGSGGCADAVLDICPPDNDISRFPDPNKIHVQCDSLLGGLRYGSDYPVEWKQEEIELSDGQKETRLVGTVRVEGLPFPELVKETGDAFRFSFVDQS